MKTSELSKTLKELLDSGHCDWTGFGPVDVRAGYATCGIQILSVSLEAQTLSLSLQSAGKKSSNVYIGPPSDELAPLIEATQRAASEVKRTANKAQGCALDPPPSYTAKLFAFSSAMSHMQDQIAAWKPYM